ncbi:MAG: hypothetical protein HYZ81_04175 [Nitrospinae bacterium]|nr:hypothetical protein [Nitrospinota bacterium]
MPTLYDRVLKSMESTLETARKSAEMLVGKAEDTAEVIKFRLEKGRLEREMSRKFAKFGRKLYEMTVREGRGEEILRDSEVQSMVEDLKRIERDLAHTQALMERELEKHASPS